MSNNPAGMAMPEKSMSSIRKPTEGFGAPSYCSSSPMPRIWKYRGREVPPANPRFGTSASTSPKWDSPARPNARASSTVTLAARSCKGVSTSVAVTTTSSSSASAARSETAADMTSMPQAQIRKGLMTCSFRRY